MFSTKPDVSAMPSTSSSVKIECDNVRWYTLVTTVLWLRLKQSPPFVLHRRGWGEFPVRIRLCFSNSLNKNVDIIHNLQLHGPNWGTFFKSSETIVDLWLHSDHVKKEEEDQLERLHERTDKLITENVKTDITLCNSNCQHTTSLDEKCMACKLDDSNFENYKSENESGLGSDSETCSNELNKYLPEEHVHYKDNSFQYRNNGAMNYLERIDGFCSNISFHHIDNIGNTAVHSSDISENDDIQDLKLENDLDNIINFDLDYGDSDLHKSFLIDNGVEAESENIFSTHTSEDKNNLLVNTLLNAEFPLSFLTTENTEYKNKEQAAPVRLDNELNTYSYSNDKLFKFNHEKIEISPQDVQELEHFEKKNIFTENEKNMDVRLLQSDNKVGDDKLIKAELEIGNSLKSLNSIELDSKLENFNIKNESEEIFCNDSIQENMDLLNTSSSCTTNNIKSENKDVGSASGDGSNGVIFDGQYEIFDDVFNNWVEEIVIDSGNGDKTHNQCSNDDVLDSSVLRENDEFILNDNYLSVQHCKQLEKPIHNENMNICEYDNLMFNSHGKVLEYCETGNEINATEDINTISDIFLGKKMNTVVEPYNKNEVMNIDSADQKHITDSSGSEDRSKNNTVISFLNINNGSTSNSYQCLNNTGHRFNDGIVKSNFIELEHVKQNKDSLAVSSRNSFSDNDVTLKRSIFKGGSRIFIKNKRTKFKSTHLDSKHNPVSFLADPSIGANSLGSKRVIFVPSKKPLDKNMVLCSDVDSSRVGSNSILLTTSEMSDVSQVLPQSRSNSLLLNGEKFELKNNISTICSVVGPSILQRNTLHSNGNNNNNNTIPVTKSNNFIFVNKNKVQPQKRPVSVNPQNSRYVLVTASDTSKVNKPLIIQKSPVLHSTVSGSSTKHILVSSSVGNTKDGRLIVMKPSGVSVLKTKQQPNTSAESCQHNAQTVAQYHQLNVSGSSEKTGFRHKTVMNRNMSKEIITETRIAQLYKCRDDLVNNCKFADIEAAVRWLVRGLPLVHKDACFLPFKALHPYCAPDTETFISWPRPKQHAAEWLRAKTVQRILKSKDMENVWSTKQIMYWSRHHGYSPSYKLRSELEGCLSESGGKGNIFIDKLTEFTPATEALNWAESDTTEIDVVGFSNSTQQTATCDSKEEIVEYGDIIDNSEFGRGFHTLINKTIKQIDHKIKQKVLEGRSIHSGAAQLVISRTVHIFAEDLLRRSLAASHQRQGTAVELEDTHAALLSRPEFDLFTNRGLGVITDD